MLSFLVWNAMSFALPTAIVAKMEFPERDVIGIAGDGASLMTIADFVTACDYGANIVMVVFNDGAYSQIVRPCDWASSILTLKPRMFRASWRGK